MQEACSEIREPIRYLMTEKIIGKIKVLKRYEIDNPRDGFRLTSSQSDAISVKRDGNILII